jgi:glucose-1-phosphate cytidylyltransferase
MAHGKLATVSAVRPPARFGYMKIENNLVSHFGEKNQSDEGWINGGFFVLDSKVSQYVDSLDEPFETGALVRLANESQLMAFHHEGFWQPMDTLREKRELEKEALQPVPSWLNF